MRALTRLLLLAALATAATALADISPHPIRARMERPERLAVAGREFGAVIMIEAAHAAEIRDLALAGEGWTVARFAAPRDLALAAGQSQRYELAATPRAGFGKLVLTATVDGRAWRQTFDPSPEGYGGIMPTDSDLLPPQRILPALGERFPEPPRFTAAEMAAIARAEVQSPPADKSRTGCTVTGNVCYWHGTQNRWLPSYASHVMGVVFPEGGFYYYTPVVETDELGRFSFTVPAGARFYIRFNATSRAVCLQEDGIWEEDYSWGTMTTTLAPDQTQFDAGPIYPGHHPGALHICTDLTYAHDHFRDLGWDVTQIDVQWPDDDGSFYQPWFEELHIDRGDEWHDHTLCHEWGHYWHAEHAHAVEVDYCNGICDEPDDCGHCAWCPEEDRVAWIEGCAQILSRLLTDHLATRVMFDVIHQGLDTDVVHDTPDCPWQPWNIENVVAGAIYDMADDDTGYETNGLRNDVLGNDVYDQLNLTTSDILRIMADHCDVEGHEPYRMPAFFRCAAQYIDGLGTPSATREDLWETAWSWDLQLDTEAPAVVPNLSSSFPVNTPQWIAMGGFYWDEPSDDMSSACAYSVALTMNGPVAPDHVIDVTARQWWPDEALTPGTWYFTVVAVDRAGNWATTPSAYGPIIITDPGPADVLPYRPTGWTASLVLRSTLAPEPPQGVTQTTNVQSHTVYVNWAVRNDGTGPSGLFHDMLLLDGAPLFTSTGHSLSEGVSSQYRNVGPVDLGAIGRHTAWIRIDGEDDVAESNENNNIFAKQFVFTPADLAPGQTIVRDGGLPAATAGHALIAEGTTCYPNGDGFDVELCLFPELVWAVPDDPADRLVMRLHARDVGQTGFREALATANSLADRPAAILHNPAESDLFSYCIGVSDEQDSGNTYRIHREVGQMFAMPDTVTAVLSAESCLDYYFTYNDLDDPAWFTIKLANNSPGNVMMRFFAPGFVMGNLSAADVTLAAAGGDTVHHNLRLEPGEMALTVVHRDPRVLVGSQYRIFAYVEKPDLETATPTGWFANVVPHVGTPYSPVQGSVPAPSRLVGAADSTGIYWSLHNASQSAGVPVGLQRRIDLDGTTIISSMFIEALPPDHEVRVAQSSLYTVRGGRHTLTHRLNSTHGIDEDDYGNNDHGRQWVWTPSALANAQNHTVPLPAPAYGGLGQVDEGVVAPNCDGYRFTNTVSLNIPSLYTIYAVGSAADVDLGIYESADVQNGFTAARALSTWSGAGCDFVLRYTMGMGTYANHVGVTRAPNLAFGNVTLRAQSVNLPWTNPVGNTRTGTVEAGTFFDSVALVLPAGDYRFTLQSDDEPLGFSLHDLSTGYSAKSTPWQDGIAWQESGLAGTDVSFAISVPDPAPTRFGLVVWRPDAASLAQDAAWSVTVDVEAVGVDDDAPLAPATVSLAAFPNPFNPATVIEYGVGRAGPVSLAVFDLAGRRVATLVDREHRDAGRYTIGYRADQSASGVYFVRLQTANGDATEKIVLLK
ncbi:MAG: CARDB domain-containing protein [Candidatus Krumholzibacteriia bacterium]